MAFVRVQHALQLQGAGAAAAVATAGAEAWLLCMGRAVDTGSGAAAHAYSSCEHTGVVQC